MCVCVCVCVLWGYVCCPSYEAKLNPVVKIQVENPGECRVTVLLRLLPGYLLPRVLGPVRVPSIGKKDTV